MASSITALLAGAVLAGLSAAQFPPPRTGVTWVQSQHNPDIHISYKDPQICETTPGVKSYAGYVHFPPNAINETGESQPYPINTFFWFVEARTRSPHRAPLSIWLNGGPGGSSLMGMLAENGPCWINEDGNSTRINEWAWNREVNMLFIDQPVQVGFSYDALYNGTLDLLASAGFDYDPDELTGPIELRDDFADGVPETNATFYVGTFASQNSTHTPNTTEHAAVAMWHFAQTWFEEFPEYKPHDEKISLWSESYGGRYGPAFMHYFQKQNGKISRGEITAPGTHYLHIDTLGIINGCIDDSVQGPAYSYFAWNNTYGIQAINETTKHGQLYELERPGGLREQITECQRLSKALEEQTPAITKTIDEAYVEAYCRNASETSSRILVGPYVGSTEFGWFDITHSLADPFPRNYHLAWLNQHWVQSALGVPVNFTASSEIVGLAFEKAGDMARHGYLTELAHLLDHGVKVHLVYGDRDYACNWIGGEAASLAIPHRHRDAFAAAGYAPLTLPGTDAGEDPAEGPPFVPYGLTRQHGNLSFTRVFQAGHMVPSYQPEAALRVFERALFNRDIATGTVDLRATGGWEGREAEEVFSSRGTPDTWWRRNEIMPAPESKCQILSLMTCTKEEIQALRDGTAVVKNYILVGIEEKEDGHAGTAGSEKTAGGLGNMDDQVVLGVDEL